MRDPVESAEQPQILPKLAAETQGWLEAPTPERLVQVTEVLSRLLDGLLRDEPAWDRSAWLDGILVQRERATDDALDLLGWVYVMRDDTCVMMPVQATVQIDRATGGLAKMRILFADATRPPVPLSRFSLHRHPVPEGEDGWLFGFEHA